MPYKLVKSDDDKVLIYSAILAFVFFFFIMPKIDKEKKKEDFIEEFQIFSDSDYLSDQIHNKNLKKVNNITIYKDLYSTEPLELSNGAEIDHSTNLELDDELAHHLECKYECCNFPGNYVAPKYIQGKKGIRKISGLSGKIYTCSKGCLCFDKKDRNNIVSNGKNSKCGNEINYKYNYPHIVLK